MANEDAIDITFEEVKKGIESGTIILIDVREPKELKSDGKIPTSYNIPSGEIENAFKLSPGAFQKKYGFPKPSPTDKNVVVSCRSGRRAAAAVETMEDEGYDCVRIYQGSYLEWKEKGGKLIKDPIPPTVEATAGPAPRLVPPVVTTAVPSTVTHSDRQQKAKSVS